jgi:hypothetical protein
MKSILVIISTFVVLYATDKSYYKPTNYYYSINPHGLRDSDIYYSIEQVTQDDVVKSHMGWCLTQFEKSGDVLEECIATLNTLVHYKTTPEDAIRKDVLEYYHDMPISEYEKKYAKKSLSVSR